MKIFGENFSRSLKSIMVSSLWLMLMSILMLIGYYKRLMLVESVVDVVSARWSGQAGASSVGCLDVAPVRPVLAGEERRGERERESSNTINNQRLNRSPGAAQPRPANNQQTTDFSTTALRSTQINSDHPTRADTLILTQTHSENTIHM